MPAKFQQLLIFMWNSGRTLIYLKMKFPPFFSAHVTWCLNLIATTQLSANGVEQTSSVAIKCVDATKRIRIGCNYAVTVWLASFLLLFCPPLQNHSWFSLFTVGNFIISCHFCLFEHALFVIKWCFPSFGPICVFPSHPLFMTQFVMCMNPSNLVEFSSFFRHRGWRENESRQWLFFIFRSWRFSLSLHLFLSSSLQCS